MSKMLIDARHPEETRVVVLKGNRIEEFDFESESKRQLKGNIYLAKVTRVEPSLQACFVEYGGNRHGFLPLSEIHPDYYQIPHEDRVKLLQEEHHAQQVHDEEQAEMPAQAEDDIKGEAAEDTDSDHEAPADDHANNGDDLLDEPAAKAQDDISEAGSSDEADADAARRRRTLLRRRYKIQEVIHRRQILLVQVVKEERGGKGAALTTYLSLAGRYSVLMPNTTNAGGISRKIASVTDRKRLKDIMTDLALPAGMGCIIRTAGLQRTRIEIKRDFDYLTRLWDEIRETTLQSVAPCLIYEDSSLIKRAIRDIYNKDIDEVLIDGEVGYRAARDFMKLLMPSHVKKVQLYREPVPLFQRFQVEAQMETMYHPTVQLKSGGYIVINPTEALVSIDINSGRSTKEYNIEETALKTNCEAADEIARQLRLRDMAGLVVIDFIDMENGRNVKLVEKRLKDALKADRARIQVGRISNFGLLEMSRQRIRTGVLEASTHVCETCKGTGFVRSIPSAALFALRGLEEEAGRGRASELTLRVPADIAVYILNKKRLEIAELETRYGIHVDVVPKEALISPDFEIERAGAAPAIVPAARVAQPVAEEDDGLIDATEADEESDDEAIGDEMAESTTSARDTRETREHEGESGRNKRRRRRKRRGNRREEDGGVDSNALPSTHEHEEGGETIDAAAERTTDADTVASESEMRRRKRRRGRRGGRNRDRDHQTSDNQAGGDIPPQEIISSLPSEASEAAAHETKENSAEIASQPAITLPEPALTIDAEAIAAVVEVTAPEEAPAKPKRVRKSRAKVPSPEPAEEVEPLAVTANIEAVVAAPVAANDGSGDTVIPAPAQPPRKGWWQRTFSGG